MGNAAAGEMLFLYQLLPVFFTTPLNSPFSEAEPPGIASQAARFHTAVEADYGLLLR